MSHPTAQNKQHALEIEIVAFVRKNPNLSDRQLANRFHVRRVKISAIRKRFGFPTPHKKHKECVLQPGGNAYVDLRGIYLGSGFQIVVLVTNNLEIEDEDWIRMSYYTASERVPLSPASTDRVRCAKLGKILDQHSNSNLGKNGAKASIQPADWLTGVEVHAHEMAHVLIASGGRSLVEMGLGSTDPVLIVEGSSLATHLTNIMLSPEFGTLGCAAFPSLFSMLERLKKSDFAQLKLDHSICALKLRFAAADAIGLTGLYVSEPQPKVRDKSGSTKRASFQNTFSRLRKSVSRVSSTGQKPPLFPLSLRIQGAERVPRGSEEGVSADGYILDTDELRDLFAQAFVTRAGLALVKNALHAQELFFSKNLKEPLLDCAELLPRDLQWFANAKVILNMISAGSHPDLDKRRMLASLWIATLDVGLIVKAIEGESEASSKIGRIEAAFTESLLSRINSHKKALLGPNQHLFNGTHDPVNVLEDTIQLFLVKEWSAFLRRSLEIVAGFVQGEIENLALAGTANLSLAAIRSDEKAIFAGLTGPWPLVRFNFQSALKYLGVRFSGACTDSLRIRSLQTSQELARLGRLSPQLRNKKEFEGNHASDNALCEGDLVTHWVRTLLRMPDANERGREIIRMEAAAKKRGAITVMTDEVGGEFDLPAPLESALREYFRDLAGGGKTALLESRAKFESALSVQISQRESRDGRM